MMKRVEKGDLSNAQVLEAILLKDIQIFIPTKSLLSLFQTKRSPRDIVPERESILPVLEG